MSSQTSSADAIAGNADLLTDILLRLPLKSLLRFKSVSKHWFSLISDPHFALLRNPYPYSAAGLFLRRPLQLFNQKFDFIPLDDNKSDRSPFTDPTGVDILQSCNGLFCCSRLQVFKGFCEYYINNPTTKQSTCLPGLRNNDLRFVSSVNLAFDPSKSPHYKVICVWDYESRPDQCNLPDIYHLIEIYSSETGVWKVSGNPFTAKTSFNDGVFWNGAIHWITNSQIYNSYSLCFDVDQERLFEMPMPPIPKDFKVRNVRYFGESRDHLHLVEIYGPRTSQFSVYEMERDYSGWFVKYNVDLDSTIASFPEIPIRSFLDPPYYYEFAILCLVRGEIEENSFLVLRIPGKAIQYNLIDGTVMKICDIEDSGNGNSLRFRCFSADQYMESIYRV